MTLALETVNLSVDPLDMPDLAVREPVIGGQLSFAVRSYRQMQAKTALPYMPGGCIVPSWWTRAGCHDLGLLASYSGPALSALPPMLFQKAVPAWAALSTAGLGASLPRKPSIRWGVIASASSL